MVVDQSRAVVGSCSFDVEYELSTKIATVGIVRWTSDFDDIREARLEFGLPESETRFTAPVDLDTGEHRTLLLGMKGERRYDFRIVVSDGDAECVSRDFPITTRPLPNSIPTLRREVYDADRVEPGFIVTSSGIGSLGEGGSSPAFIVDSDGDVVWYWLDTPPQTSRANLDWSGARMWMLALNVIGAAGEVSTVSMDGLDTRTNIAGFEDTHHDFTVLPDGTITAIAHHAGCSSIIERRPDGTTTTIVESVASLYKPGKAVFVTSGDAECHPNSIHYHPKDDSYTLSDRYVHAYVKFARSGELLWQLGGHDPLGASFDDAVWAVNHGHHVLDNGNFLVFSNGNAGEDARVLEYELDESTWHAERIWEYSGGVASPTLGDVQRLPGGNTLVTYSNAGVMHEVDPDGNLVQKLETESLGYTTFRTSLYGPPPR